MKKKFKSRSKAIENTFRRPKTITNFASDGPPTVVVSCLNKRLPQVFSNTVYYKEHLNSTENPTSIERRRYKRQTFADCRQVTFNTTIRSLAGRTATAPTHCRTSTRSRAKP